MKKIILFIATITLGACATTSGVVQPGETRVQDYNVAGNKESVFKSALVSSQLHNLNVQVIEKDSGIIRFETANISSRQLDEYCTYPVVKPDGQPWDTFSNWNSRSVSKNGGTVRGKVSMTLLISERGGVSKINMRSNWNAANNTESYACNSTGRFEGQFITEIKRQLEAQ